MSGKPSRDKGARGEREIARIYREQGFDVRRVPNSGGLDVKGDCLGLDGYHIEVKRQERLNVWAALEQAASEAPDGSVPALHFRRNGSDWYVALPLEAFLRLLK